MLDLPNVSVIAGNAVRWGKIGSGPALVAIHGTPLSFQVWSNGLPHLADLRTVYSEKIAGRRPLPRCSRPFAGSAGEASCGHKKGTFANLAKVPFCLAFGGTGGI